MEQLNFTWSDSHSRCRCSWHPPTGWGSSRWDTFPRENKPLWTGSLASLWRASPNARRRTVQTKTRSIWETASTTYPRDNSPFEEEKVPGVKHLRSYFPVRKQGTSKWGPRIKRRTCDPLKRFVEWRRGRCARDAHQRPGTRGGVFNPITKHFMYL